jgi:tripartite-type tricarboxylate transporter receptor subunit TctC
VSARHDVPHDLARARRVINRRTLAALLALPGAARAQVFPDRPLRMLVSNAPGGGMDSIARMTAGPLGQVLGQPVVVENRPGAGGTIAAENLLRAPLDGHSLLFFGLSSLAMAPITWPNLPYQQLVPVGSISRTPMVLLVHASVPANSVAELRALARSRPNALSYATPGHGTTPHLLAVRFAQVAGAELLHVPYQGGSQQIGDLIGGRVQVMFDTLAATLGTLQTGSVKALAITTEAPDPLLPGVPTMAQAGMPELTYALRNLLLVPAALSPALRVRLAAALGEALALPEARAAFARLGVAPLATPAAEVVRMVEREREEWGPVARLATGRG